MNLYDIWFNCVSLQNQVKNELLENFNAPEEIWKYINKGGSFDSKTIDKALRSSMNMDSIKKTIEVVEAKEMHVINCRDEKYPQKLKELPDYPYLIYYYGDIKKVNTLKAVSMVGSRRCTAYGRNAATEIASGLAKYQVNIVSGMARGIDSVSHWAAINNDGFTTAVMGCGLDRIYPTENRKLFNEIKSHGCLISEFPPGTPPFAYNFPLRNRIISGLSDMIIVVEAAKDSGSLITAGRAADQGRTVMAVPGSVFSKQSKGTNELIRDGADIFIDMDQLLETLGILKQNDEKDNLKKVFNDTKMETIYSVLTDTPTHIDDIIRITNIDISILYELLLEMQLENTIKCIAGSYYVRINDSL